MPPIPLHPLHAHFLCTQRQSGGSEPSVKREEGQQKEEKVERRNFVLVT